MSILAVVLLIAQAGLVVRIWARPRRPKVPTDTELLSTHEVALALGVPPASVRSRIVAGEIPLARGPSGRVGIPLSYVIRPTAVDHTPVAIEAFLPAPAAPRPPERTTATGRSTRAGCAANLTSL